VSRDNRIVADAQDNPIPRVKPARLAAHQDESPAKLHCVEDADHASIEVNPAWLDLAFTPAGRDHQDIKFRIGGKADL
jgi:hypothetical protein